MNRRQVALLLDGANDGETVAYPRKVLLLWPAREDDTGYFETSQQDIAAPREPNLAIRLICRWPRHLHLHTVLVFPNNSATVLRQHSYSPWDRWN